MPMQQSNKVFQFRWKYCNRLGCWAYSIEKEVQNPKLATVQEFQIQKYDRKIINLQDLLITQISQSHNFHMEVCKHFSLLFVEKKTNYAGMYSIFCHICPVVSCCHF